MEYFQIGLYLMVLQQHILNCLGMCDQRENGGELKCCRGRNSKCFVKVQNKHNYGHNSIRANTICYCDNYCVYTNDCCADYVEAQTQCSNSKNCVVSDWGTWSECNTDCGIGSMRRRRRVLRYPLNGGKPCPTLTQTRGCNIDCNRNNYATILPIEYRRPELYLYEDIQPASSDDQHTKNTEPYSFCIHYTLTNKRGDCRTSWGTSLYSNRPVCVECQSRVMHNGHCRGEGALGLQTRWKALNIQRCHGQWIRLGPIIPDCKCSNKEFTNFVFI